MSHPDKPYRSEEISPAMMYSLNKKCAKKKTIKSATSKIETIVVKVKMYEMILNKKFGRKEFLRKNNFILPKM